MRNPAPGKGLFGWLGRQVGYVKKAVQAEPGSKVVYRGGKIEEKELPHQPGVKLRRTVIDEVIVDQAKLPKAGDGKC